MNGYSRDVASSSSLSTAISPRAISYRASDANPSAPRKRTWGGGLFKSATKSSYVSSHSKTPTSSLTLEASLNMLSLDTQPQSLYESNCQKLRELIQKLIPISSNVHHIDSTYKEYNDIRTKVKALCEALLTPPSRIPSPQNPVPLSSPHPSSNLPRFSDTSSLSSESRTSTSSGSPGNGYQSPYIYEQHLDLIRTWTVCLRNLLNAMRTTLVATYKEYEPDASPAMVEQLFQDPKFREIAMSRIHNAITSKPVSMNPEFFSQYEKRFRDYDKLKLDLTDIRSLLQDGESGISPDRTIEETTVSPRGDAILEFANKESENFPVLRFRVSSHMLTETSPIFAQMFTSSTLLPPMDEDIASALPPPPSRYMCKDGTEVNLFRMPQLELNLGGSFQILLHAAHMHNDKIPREISFDTFVAIAEVCMRYQCTAPLEMSVEYLWLPQWMHKATEDMPGGLLLISYAFGLRRLFTRMSKTAILNIAWKEDLESFSWPQKVKDKVWAVHKAKMDQVYHCCSSTIQEYLRCTPTTLPASAMNNTAAGLVPTMKPRCARGDHACDAACLGWFMMLLNELQVLPHIINNAALGRRPPPPRRSLNQLIDCFRYITSPPQTHSGPCDFAPTFRAAINDIYNSVAGLTLFDVSGKHGWALSKHKSLLPQPVLKLGAPLPDLDAARRTTEEVALRIMREQDNLEDVFNVALVNKAFFEAFKSNELVLLRNLIGKSKAPARWTLNGAGNKQDARAELKLLKKKDASPQQHKAATNLADIEEGLRSINITSDEVVQAPNYQSVFDDDDSDLDDCLEATDSESLVEIANTEQNTLEEKMTREEAERILWPDDEIEASSINPVNMEPLPTANLRVGAEKFRANDMIFRNIEAKSLVTKEEKNLSNEHYERIGLVRAKENETRDNTFELI